MENASKAIGLSVGAILFMIAITISIIMYSNMIRTMNTTLSINNIKTNVIENENTATDSIKYLPSDIYFMLEGVRENIKNGKKNDIYSTNFSINGTIIDADGSNIPSAPTTGVYSLTYTYEYSTSDLIDLNNHKIASIRWF